MSGNFHIAAGKSVPLMRGHAHLTTLFDDNEANFSHRIGHYSHFSQCYQLLYLVGILWLILFQISDRFSFGDPHGSIIQPLEGDEKITDNGKITF